MKTKSDSVVRQYGLSVGYKLLCVALSFGNSVLINRCLGVELRGEYTAITNLASLLQLLLNLGIGNAYPMYKRKDPDNAKTIFSTVLYCQLILYLCIAIPVVLTVPIFYKYVAIIAVLCVIENQVIFVSIVESVVEKNRFNLVTTIIYMLNLFITYYAFRYSVTAVMIAVIADHCLLTFGLIIKFKIFECKPRLLNAGMLGKIFRVSIPAMLMNILMYINYHADILFLQYMIEDYYMIGLYGTAVTLGNMLWILPDAFKDVIYNRSAKKDNPEEISLSIILNMCLCFCVLVGFVFLGRWFLETAYGADFVEAYPMVLMLFVGTFPMILYKLIHPLYISKGNTRIAVSLLSIAAITNVIGNILLIPKYSAYGAAVASIFSYSVCGVAFLLKFNKDFSISVKKIIEFGKQKLDRRNIHK